MDDREHIRCKNQHGQDTMGTRSQNAYSKYHHHLNCRTTMKPTTTTSGRNTKANSAVPTNRHKQVTGGQATSSNSRTTLVAAELHIGKHLSTIPEVAECIHSVDTSSSQSDSSFKERLFGRLGTFWQRVIDVSIRRYSYVEANDITCSNMIHREPRLSVAEQGNSLQNNYTVWKRLPEQQHHHQMAISYKLASPDVGLQRHHSTTAVMANNGADSVWLAKRRPIVGDAMLIDEILPSLSHSAVADIQNFYITRQVNNGVDRHKVLHSSMRRKTRHQKQPNVTPINTPPTYWQALPKSRLAVAQSTHFDVAPPPRVQHGNGHNARLMISTPRKTEQQQDEMRAFKSVTMRRSRSQPMHKQLITMARDDDAATHSINNKYTSEAMPDGECTTAARLNSGTVARSSMNSTASSGNSSNTDSFVDKAPKQRARTMTGEVLWENISMSPEELALSNGDIVTITDWTRPDIWYGVCKDRAGWFPPSCIQILMEQRPSVPDVLHKRSSSTVAEESRDSGHSSANEDDVIASTSDDLQQSSPLSTDSDNEKWIKMRGRIINEILSTERDYHRLISKLVQGFVQAARNRQDLFTSDKLQIIFGNLEDILSVHNRFLLDLENEYNTAQPGATCIGHCFLRHEECFEVYSDYCNNRPLSCAELVNLTGNIQYDKFFECCRLLCDLPNLPLDGFLLTPVQRICRYPLQLTELVKATRSSHPDYAASTQALCAMKRVAIVINDRKRRVESLQKLVIWQHTVANWKGDDLLLTSSKLFHYGEMNIKLVIRQQTQWSKDLSAFLFDGALILCKRDLLTRTKLIYKHRINLRQCCDTIDLSDGKDVGTSQSVKCAIRLDTVDEENNNQNISYLLSFRNKKIKTKWLDSLQEQKCYAQIQSSATTVDERRIALASMSAQYQQTLGTHTSGVGPASPNTTELTRRVPSKDISKIHRANTAQMKITKL